MSGSQTQRIRKLSKAIKLEQPTVLAVHLRDDGIMDGCNHYRFRIPFQMIRKKVPGSFLDWAPMRTIREWSSVRHDTIMPTDYDIMMLPRHRPLPWGIDTSVEDVPQDLWDAITDLGIEVEQKSHLLDLVTVLKAKQKVVLEYDDDYFTDSRDLGYEYKDLLHELLTTVDAITVSTDYLQKVVRKYAPTTPTYVLPNCVNMGEWDSWDRWKRWPKDYVVLALTGSATHDEDWRIMRLALQRIMKKHGNVALIIGGYEPDYLKNLQLHYPDRVYVSPPLVYEEYPMLIRQSDIVLCPVVPDDAFNQSKSAIKAIEGMASNRSLSNGKNGGSVPIVSNLNYYRRATGGNRRGITVKQHTVGAWVSAIETLVTNQELRNTMAQKGRSWVIKNRSIERQWKLWWSAYTEIYRRKT